VEIVNKPKALLFLSSLLKRGTENMLSLENSYLLSFNPDLVSESELFLLSLNNRCTFLVHQLSMMVLVSLALLFHCLYKIN
jgi:hypothetical protein